MKYSLLLIQQFIVFVIFFSFLNTTAGTLPDGFAETRLAQGLDGTTVNYAPDGRLFVTQKKGVINIIKNGVMLSTPFLDIQSLVNNQNERGLQNMTFDPNFQSNGYIYIYYYSASQGRNRVSRFTANGDVVVPGSEVVLVNLDALSGSIHNGGALFFKGGKLFIATGDGGNGSNSASFNSLLGKVLRINSDGSIPSDNPYFTTLSGSYRMIYALGLRNPYRAAVQPGTERVFINDVGGSLFEEINELIAGKNYGWPSVEGKRTNQTPPANYQDPVYAYPRSMGCSIGGGVFYNPTNSTFPSKYIGKYFFGDYCNNYIKVLDPTTGTVIETFATNINRPISFSVGNDGNFYYLARGGLSGGSSEANSQSCCSEVWRIQFTNNGIPTISAHPEAKIVSIGGSAVFAVGASGNAPLAFQWQRNGVNIPGATNYIYERSNITLADNGAVFRAVITNNLGTATSNGAVLTVTSNLPPQPVIELPTAGTEYTAGTVLTFSGSANDPEDGVLPASAFTWEINFHHDTHTHPAMSPAVGIKSGAYNLSSNHEPAINVWYRIYLTVKDSQGQQTTVHRDVHPVVASVLLNTNRNGLNLELDGVSIESPYSFDGVAGITRFIEAPLTQTLDGVEYKFQQWSDGGEAAHEILSPASDQTITAFYLPIFLEGELATLHGVRPRNNYTGYSGTGFADYDLNTGGYIEWTINVLEAGNYRISFRYANGANRGRPVMLAVNGVERVANFEFPSTGSWSEWENIETIQHLNQGTNRFRATSIGSNGPIIDYLMADLNDAPIPSVADPVFSPSPGTYTSPQTISISTASQGATIYYTLNGSTPTTSSSRYSAPITISNNTTVNAIAVKTGMSSSDVITGNYTINSASSSIYEAELATLSGVFLRKNYAGFTGSGYADFEGASGTYIQWVVDVPATGAYRLDFRYANGSNKSRPLQITVNNVISETAKEFPSTGSWSNYQVVSSTVNLQAGTHTIRATSIGSSGSNIDHLRIHGLDGVGAPQFTPPPGNYSQPINVAIASTSGAVVYYTTNGSTPTTSSNIYSSPVNVSQTQTLKAIAVKDGISSVVTSGNYEIDNISFSQIFEAEDAIRSGVVVKHNYIGYSGTGFADYVNPSTDYLEWRVNIPAQGNYALQFRYALPTGNRPLRLLVNGTLIEAALSFPYTGSWTNWQAVSSTVSLNAGNNVIRLIATGLSGANIDYLRITNTLTQALSVKEAASSIMREETELEQYNPDDIEVFPVPAKDIVHVRSINKIQFINLTSMDGRTLHVDVDQKTPMELELGIDTIPDGVFIITFQSDTYFIKKKIIIKK